MPYVRIFDSYPPDFVQEKRGKCFPAGHAITGFAFYIFCFVCKNRHKALLCFAGVSIFGWILGFYQIAKGAHFLSDTIVAMIICHALAAIITIFCRKFLIKLQTNVDFSKHKTS